VRELKAGFDCELQVPGSHRLVQELIEGDLVDQVNLMVFPVILGTGKKAFEETPERRRLRLKESKVVGEGVLVLIYERIE
jgi:dihydrofolate reductase